MSDGFMADPIRPGDMSSPSIKPGNYNMNRNNSSGVKIILVFIIIMFILPFAFALIVFFKIWNDAGSDIISQIKESTTVPAGYYKLSNDEQMAASRIFGTGILYEKGGPKTIAQSDCRHLKNSVTGYGNANNISIGWYDSSYCEAGNVGISAYYLNEDENSPGGTLARIDIQSVAGNMPICINISFAHNFRYISSVGKNFRCSVNKYEIKADNINVPELLPLNGSGTSGDDIDNPPIDYSFSKS